MSALTGCRHQIALLALGRAARGRTLDPRRAAALCVARSMIAAGERPEFRIAITGIEGLVLRAVVVGVPGTIAHARTPRAAREAARDAIAEMLGVDHYDFDLAVVIA